MPIIFTASLFLILSFEGLGVPYGREISYYLILFLIPSLFIHALLHKKNFVFPKLMTVFFLLFLISSFLSSLTSKNIPQTALYSFYQVNLFLVFVCSYNYANEIKQQLARLIFFCSALFSLYFLLLHFRIFKLIIPDNGYQFVYSHTGSHIHLGDFLIFPAILLLFNLFHKKYIKLSIIGIISLLPFIVFSFSRSAYISIALCSLILHIFSLRDKKTFAKRMTYRITLLFIVLGSVLAFLVTTSQSKNQSISSIMYTYLVQNENLANNKDLLGRRPYYFKQAIDSFYKNPIIGIGPNNFQSVSLTYAKKPFLESTETVHNIFLEVLVGQGILGFLPFAGIIIFILRKSKKNGLYFALIAMLLNFQTDYTYQIYSLLLLFFVLAGSLYVEKNCYFLKFQGILKKYTV